MKRNRRERERKRERERVNELRHHPRRLMERMVFKIKGDNSGGVEVITAPGHISRGYET